MRKRTPLGISNWEQNEREREKKKETLCYSYKTLKNKGRVKKKKKKANSHMHTNQRNYSKTCFFDQLKRQTTKQEKMKIVLL